jgi:energy-coupling factor transport system permease protein
VNEFEFMRDLPVGQYVPGDSVLYRLDPRTRILATIAFLMVLTFVPNTAGLLVGLAAGIAGWGLARMVPTPAMNGWRAAIPFLLILALLQIVFQFRPESGAILYQNRWMVVSTGDLWAGVNLILRFSAYIFILGLSSAVLSASQITRGLDALLRPLAEIGFPVHDLVMVVQVTLRFFPLLAQTAERIAKAQASRGADWSMRGGPIQRARRMAPMLVPLFVTSLRRAENLALAMDARAYGSGTPRTSMTVLQFRRADFFALLVVTVIIALMIFL